MPFEGSVIISNEKMEMKYAGGTNLKFLIFKRTGQLLRALYLNTNIGKPDGFLKFFDSAEKYYYTSKIYRIPPLNKYLIRKYDTGLLKKNNPYYHRRLEEYFSKYAIYSLNSDNFVPYAFMMLIPGRDKARMLLKENGIFCPVHWLLPEQINKDKYSDSWDVSEKTISIPLSGIEETKLDILIFNITNSLESKSLK
jgi:hypothetical protein